MLAGVTRRIPSASRIRRNALRSFSLKSQASSSSQAANAPLSSAATAVPTAKKAGQEPPATAAPSAAAAPSAETEDPSKHSSDIAFKPTDSGWGYSRSYSGGFENIFKKAKDDELHEVEAADRNYSSGREDAKIPDFERGYTAGYTDGLAAGANKE